MRWLPAVLVGVGLLVHGCTGVGVEPDPVMLRVVLAEDWASAPLVGQVLETFEQERPGVQVQVHGVPFSQVPEVVAAAAELGQPYDLAHWHAFAAAAAGLAEPVDDLWEAAGLEPDAVLPGALLDVTWDGRRYGVPLDVNALVLLANQDLLRAAGLHADDLRSSRTFPARAAALAALPQTDHALVVTASSWAAYGWIIANGGQLLAFALTVALTEREVGLALVAEEGRLPARRDAYEDPLFDSRPQLAAFVAQLDHATVMPLIAFPEVSIAFRDGLEALLSLRRTPAEAMADVQAVADRWRAGR